MQLEVYTEQAYFLYPSLGCALLQPFFRASLQHDVYLPLKDPSCFRSEVARLSSQLPVSQASELRPQPSPARPVSRCQDPLVLK